LNESALALVYAASKIGGSVSRGSDSSYRSFVHNSFVLTCLFSCLPMSELSF
jgi:hypothetical protein